MRMRKKRHLEERLAACSDVCLGLLSDGFHDDIEGVITEPIDTAKVFGRDAPLHLEIGCGKGQFAEEKAEREPDIDLIAVEQAMNVLVTAMERTHLSGRKNLRYIAGKAEYLQKALKSGSVDVIYLNFSCPFPKNVYSKHRLTHPRFLEIYRDILKDGGEIIQKTDNKDLFEFSLKSFKSCGFGLSDISRDLHNSGIQGNIITEYEQRFSSQGLPIYYVRAICKKNV